MVFQGVYLFLSAVIVTAAGFVAAYFSHKAKSGWLSASAWILIAGGALTIACSAYHTVRYQAFGHGDTGGDSCPMMQMGGKSEGMSGMPDKQTMQGMMQTMEGMQGMMTGMMKSKGMMDSKEMKGMMKDMDGMRDMMKGMMNSTGSGEMKGMESTDGGSTSDDSSEHAGHHH